MKILKFGIKNTLFGYFWAGISKSYRHIWNQHSQICIIAKFGAKTKILKFGTKNTLNGYFGGAIENNIVIFEISSLEFFLLQSLVQK